MMMRMLDAGGYPILADRLRAADEDNPHGYYEFEPVKRLEADASWLEMAEGKAVKIIDLLLYHLPPKRTYRLILMRRPLGEVVASQQKMLARRPDYAELPKLSAEQLVEIFTRQTQKLASWLARQPHIQVLEVDYLQTLRDPLGTAEAVRTFLGGRLDRQAMAQGVDATLHRQRL